MDLSPPVPLNAGPSCPSRRTYAVKTSGDARPTALAGRLENPVAGQGRAFASGRELLESIVGDVRANGEERELMGKP